MAPLISGRYPRPLSDVEVPFLRPSGINGGVGRGDGWWQATRTESVLYVAPSCVHIRKDHLFSITSASNRLPQGPQRRLITTFLNMLTNWDSLEERALLWTGMFNKPQRAALHQYIQRLLSARSRALLTSTCRRFLSATRAIWEDFGTIVTDAGRGTAWAPLTPLPPRPLHQTLENQYQLRSWIRLRTPRPWSTACSEILTPSPVSGKRLILVNSYCRTSMPAWTRRWIGSKEVELHLGG